MKRKRLLIIDDLEAYKEYYSGLTEFPFDKIEVTVISNEREFEQIKNTRFDFCVCDWRLQDRNADDYYDRVKCEKFYVITHLDEIPVSMIEFCNKNGVSWARKPISDEHIKVLLGYGKKKLFMEMGK